MKKSYDIVIIGGGIIGCSTAFELSKRGRKDVLVIENKFLTSGSTGRCGAGIRQQWGSPLNATLAYESTCIFENLEEYTGYDKNCGLNQGGYLLVAYTDSEWAQFHKNLEVQHSIGIESVAVETDRIKDIVPHINTEGMHGATYCAKDGHADPFHCTFAYAGGAERNGVEFSTYTTVTDILTENGKMHTVRTTKGDVSANIVINCTGNFAGKIAKMVGDDLPISPERHQLIITEPIAHIMDPMVMSFHRHFYAQQTPHGSVLMGIGDPLELESFNLNSSWQFLEECAHVVTQTLPVFRNLKVIRQCAGLYDMSPDRNPIITESQNVKGFISICGFSGHGFMVAPRVAILVANHLTGGKDSLDIHKFSARRYETGELLLEPSVV